MEPMILGETLTIPAATQYSGFWMPSGGSDGVAAFEVFFVSGTSLVVGVESKNSEAADPAPLTAVVGFYFGAITSPGIFNFELVDAKDLVRYALSNTGLSPVTVHIKFARPAWAPN